jgi:hypothetical protein
MIFHINFEYAILVPMSFGPAALHRCGELLEVKYPDTKLQTGFYYWKDSNIYQVTLRLSKEIWFLEWLQAMHILLEGMIR